MPNPDDFTIGQDLRKVKGKLRPLRRIYSSIVTISALAVGSVETHSARSGAPDLLEPSPFGFVPEESRDCKNALVAGIAALISVDEKHRPVTPST